MYRSTLEDVAKSAGVSIKTVSRVVNNEPNVSEDTQKRVSRAIEELNYRPNVSARNLASQRSHLIALLYDDPAAYELPSSGYIINMQEGVLKACRENNYDLLIHPCRPKNRNIIREIKSLIDHARPDGIIVAAPLSNMPKIIRTIESAGTTVVCLSPGKKDPKHSTISTNDQEISGMMVHHLHSLGHKSIAFIAGEPSHKAVANRLSGFRKGMQECGLKIQEALILQGDNSVGAGETATEKLMARKSPPTAIFAANDDMAVGVMRAAKRLGIVIPDELSVAGYDDIALAKQVYPTLTTITQPLAKMAEHAAKIVIEGATSKEAVQRFEIIPGTLQIRESTGRVPEY